MYRSSVVQPGVTSFGCENSTAEESPTQSWKPIRPSVVSASKSGAVSPICRAIFFLLWKSSAHPPTSRRPLSSRSPYGVSKTSRCLCSRKTPYREGERSKAGERGCTLIELRREYSRRLVRRRTKPVPWHLVGEP